MYATLHASERVVRTAGALVLARGDAHPVLCDLVGAEAGVHAPAAVRRAIEQTGGDPGRAVTLVRVWAATLPALRALPVLPSDVRVHRRVSAAFSEISGGQWLGAAPQFASRLLRFDDGPADAVEPPVAAASDVAAPARSDCPRVAALLAELPVHEPPPEGDGPDPTERPLTFPATRGARLAALARGETGALVALAGLGHARQREEVLVEATASTVELRVPHPRTGVPVHVADVPICEAEVVTDAEVTGRPGFAVGYGASLGHAERRAISAAIIDGGLQIGHAALDEAAVMAAVDGPATMGFVEHLCLPHHASFGSYLAMVAGTAETAAVPDEEDG